MTRARHQLVPYPNGAETSYALGDISGLPPRGSRDKDGGTLQIQLKEGQGTSFDKKVIRLRRSTTAVTDLPRGG